MVNAGYELRQAYYANGYKNDHQFPELPCPSQPTEYVCPEEELYRVEVSAFVKEILPAKIDEIPVTIVIKRPMISFGICN
jgi:hypothetical protein